MVLLAPELSCLELLSGDPSPESNEGGLCAVSTHKPPVRMSDLLADRSSRISPSSRGCHEASGRGGSVHGRRVARAGSDPLSGRLPGPARDSCLGDEAARLSGAVNSSHVGTPNCLVRRGAPRRSVAGQRRLTPVQSVLWMRPDFSGLMGRPVSAGRPYSVLVPTSRYMYGGGHFPSRQLGFFGDVPFDLARETSDWAFTEETDRRAAFAPCVPNEERSSFP